MNNKLDIHYTLEHVKYPDHKKPEYFIPDRDECIKIRIIYCCDKMESKFSEFFGYKYKNSIEPTIVIQKYEERVCDYPSKLLEEEELTHCPFCGAEIVYIKDNELERIQT